MFGCAVLKMGLFSLDTIPSHSARLADLRGGSPLDSCGEKLRGVVCGQQRLLRPGPEAHRVGVASPRWDLW